MTRLHPPEKSAVLEFEPFIGLGLDDIRLPQSEAQLSRAWTEISANRHIGFDTESRPTFTKGQESNGPDVVQFATPANAYVFQLRHRACEELVRAVLTGHHLVKVGFDLQQDLAQLRRRLGVEVNPVLDLTKVFHTKGYPRTLGIKSAVAIVFGQRFVKSKRVTTTNWANERLEPRQVLYAANDAFVALRVMQALDIQEARQDRGAVFVRHRGLRWHHRFTQLQFPVASRDLEVIRQRFENAREVKDYGRSNEGP